MPPTQSAVVNGPANGPGNFLPPLFNLSGLNLPSVFSLPPQQHHPHNMGHSSGQPQHPLGGGFNPSPSGGQEMQQLGGQFQAGNNILKPIAVPASSSNSTTSGIQRSPSIGWHVSSKGAAVLSVFFGIIRNAWQSDDSQFARLFFRPNRPEEWLQQDDIQHRQHHRQR
jgi:hypothetical protein